LLNINDIIESIDGQAIKGMRPESVGKMIRGDSGSQVVLDIVSGPHHLRTRVGITRSPVDSSQSSQSAAPGSPVVLQDIPIQLNRPITESMAPPPPAPVRQRELSDYDASYASVKSYAPPSPSTPVAPPAVVPGAMYTPRSSANRCGVGLGFEFQPSRGVLVLRAIDSQIESPFQLGDCLVEVNGTCIASNSMLAPSLLWGDAGTCINLKMMRGHEAPRQIDATMIRKSSWLDSNLITMAGGGKTCGIGVVLETEASSGCFYIKRVVHGGPASSAGVQHGDLVTHIDGKDMRAFTKEQLPSLILGQEGSLLSMRLLRAGEKETREIVVMRFLDTAKAQQSNLASSTILTFDYIESVGSPVEVETFSRSLQADIVIALQTVAKRIEVVSVSLHHGLANVYVLPDFEGGDTRSVEELVREFVHQSSTQHSVLRQKVTCKSLSRINVLGQVDPQQPRLDLDKFSSLPVMQTPAEFSCNTLSQEPQESRVLCLSTSGATRSAAPADDLVGFPEITPATTSDASEKVEEVKVQTEQTVADANILSPRVLTVVRAAPPAVPCQDDSTEAQDVSPVVSPVLSPEPGGAPAESTQESTDNSNSSHNDGVPSGVPAPEHDAQAPDPTKQGRAVEDAGTAEPDELEATKLPLGRKLLSFLGHPEVNLVVGETQSAWPAEEEPEYPNLKDSESSSSQFGGGDANTQVCAEEATAEAAQAATPCPLSSQWQDEHTQICAKGATPDEVAKEVPAAKTSTETAEVSEVRTQSLRLVGVPADGYGACAEDLLCSMEISTPVADAHVDAHADNRSEAKTIPRDGSALQAIEALDPPLSLADEDQSVKKTAEADETARSAVEQAMHENLLLLQAIGTDAAMGCDAWADDVSLHYHTNTHDATGDLPEVRAPPRPSRKVDAAQRNSGPAKEVTPARPPRGFDATGASALPQIKAVSAVTERSTPAEKTMDVAPEEVQELHEKFPNRIPVVVGKAAFSIAPEVQSKKYLVPANVTLKNFHILISKRVDSLPEGMRLVLSVAGKPILESGHRKLRDLYEAQQRSKGILEVVYDVEEGEVNITQDLDESVQMGSDAFYPHEDDESNSQSTSPVKIPVQPPKQESSFPDSTHWQLKNWISLDVGPAENDESISPLSLLIGLGSNLQQMAMPNPPNNAAEAAITPSGFAGSFVAEIPVATIHSQTSQLPGKEPATQSSVVQAGIGLKIERDVGGKGFRITGVAPEGPAGKSGVVKVNDYLIAVDKVVVKDKKTDEAANLLKGPESSTVQLTLRRAEKMHTVTLIRAVVAKQGKVQDKPVVAPQVAKSDKVQIFGFAF
jgi:GABA(A) receptor-associated protein